jgi:hypothetical protein
MITCPAERRGFDGSDQRLIQVAPQCCRLKVDLAGPRWLAGAAPQPIDLGVTRKHHCETPLAVTAQRKDRSGASQ